MFAEYDKHYPSRFMQTSQATAVTNITKPVKKNNFGPSADKPYSVNGKSGLKSLVLLLRLTLSKFPEQICRVHTEITFHMSGYQPSTLYPESRIHESNYLPSPRFTLEDRQLLTSARTRPLPALSRFMVKFAWNSWSIPSTNDFTLFKKPILSAWLFHPLFGQRRAPE